MIKTKIYLQNGKERSVQRYHPWVFSGAIQHIDGTPADGEPVDIYDARKKFLARGHYGTGSIAVRILSFEQQTLNADFYAQKINHAFDLRKSIGLTENENTNAYRLVHGEGDGLPGLVIDIYKNVAVIQCHHLGMYLQLNEIHEAVKKVLGNKINAVYCKSKETLKQRTESTDLLLSGELTEELVVNENGNKFAIDVVHGQKTGFFLDQRDNRKLLTEYAPGKKILNAFCYSGGFSVYALKAGAHEVHSLDSSEKAIVLTERNVSLNGGGNHQSIVANATEHIKKIGDDYDIIILDPPAFAKQIRARHNAVIGYKKLNYEAIRHIKKGGLIFTFSCSQAVDEQLFTSTIHSAAIEARREVKILHRMRQPADHPVNIFHPEGEYLKGLVIKVD